MILAYRICQRRLARKAFDGEGERLYGGRWNSPGTRLVYVSSSAALAQLEMLVHLESDEILSARYVLIPVRIPPRCVRTVTADELPRNWRSLVAPRSTRRLGDEWVEAASSVALRVPSAIVPQEWNYLINPAHPDFRRLEIGKAESLSFDKRLAS